MYSELKTQDIEETVAFVRRQCDNLGDRAININLTRDGYFCAVAYNAAEEEEDFTKTPGDKYKTVDELDEALEQTSVIVALKREIADLKQLRKTLFGGLPHSEAPDPMDIIPWTDADSGKGECTRRLYKSKSESKGKKNTI